MQIKEVCILTGLSAKAIRLYESKGLVSVERAANAYREYTDEQIEPAFRLPISVCGRTACLTQNRCLKNGYKSFPKKTGRTRSRKSCAAPF